MRSMSFKARNKILKISPVSRNFQLVSKRKILTRMFFFCFARAEFHDSYKIDPCLTTTKILNIFN